MSLLPFLLKNGIDQIDSIFTGDYQNALLVASEIGVNDIVIHSDLVKECSLNSEGETQYIALEFILNKRVKFVWFKSDNIIKPSDDGYCYKIMTQGGDCLLAGGLRPHTAEKIRQNVKILELPWSVQPFGVVYENLCQFSPDLLVFSPDRNNSGSLRYRRQLTYFDNRTFAASINGSVRMRFRDDRIIVDYMIDN